MTAVSDVLSPPSAAAWARERICPDEIAKYRPAGRDFIDDAAIGSALAAARARPPEAGRVRDLIAKSRAVQALDPAELADLIHVRDPELWAEMRQAAADIKRQVYDNRIVTFAPLYLSTTCVNNCLYCGLRCGNEGMERRVLTMDEIRRETEVLAGRVGHKRLIVVYGEHPSCGVDYMVESLRAIYSVKVPARRGWGQIRRINVNAPPMRTGELRQLKTAGLGTYQVFQETYHRATYARVHPSGFKADYAWRLYTMHRAQEAGIDDVGIGALFGLHDWRFELMGLLAHARELERVFGIGPHTISFPRLEPAGNAPYLDETTWRVPDADMERLVVLIRLAVPYTGMILTARENLEMRRRLLPLGVTQTDASSRIGVGAYASTEHRTSNAESKVNAQHPTSNIQRPSGGGGRDQHHSSAPPLHHSLPAACAGNEADQDARRQQFILGDTRSLDDLVGELARDGIIVSFCTAGYRCGRTGECIMDLLRDGTEGKFCKLNAILTYREWLDDFASPETLAAGERVIAGEIEQVRARMPKAFPKFMESYERTARGERDLYF